MATKPTSGTTTGKRATRAGGRKRDGSRDVAILDAAIGILAEVGYDAMTMDLVADRARAGKATVYRRWASKPDLVLDAIRRMKREQVDLDHLPDTGTLRNDLLGLFRPQPAEEAERKLRAMAGLSTLVAQHSVLADAAHDALVKPWVEANLILMRRAVDRGEVSTAADLQTVAQVMPAMGAYRTLILHKPFDLAFLLQMIDGLVLPALGLTRPANPLPHLSPTEIPVD
jgi:AcrR family transcriptional regulator